MENKEEKKQIQLTKNNLRIVYYRCYSKCNQ